MDEKALGNVVNVKPLSEIPKFSILEISEIEEVEFNLSDGPVKCGIASYATTLPDKTREVGKVRLTETVMKSAWMVPPCICLYLGVKQVPNAPARKFHDVHALKVTSGEENLQRVADGFRKMSKTEMISCLTMQSLDSFKPNTVFFFSEPRRHRLRKDKEDVMVVKYETESDGEFLEGNLVVPLRLESKLKAQGCGVLVYKGQITTKNNRKYNDVSVLATDDC
jgi:hypothetical protein